MAFYLKYRSQTVAELDIASVREGLYGILSSAAREALPHALLFAGPRGTGKTSAARILAKAINCEKQQTTDKKKSSVVSGQGSDVELEPCNECGACRSITAGSNMDVIEIDAASHRGIDDIRDLREKVGLAPLSLKYKVYIIDEVHMLTTEAFNALLKTLEEPPARVLFVLCTTEAGKLPETIVSRCIRVHFQKASLDDTIHSLQRVVKGEKLEMEEGVLELIAKQAGGSFRDAHKLLEQVSWNKGKIKLADLKAKVGMSDSKVEKLVDLVGEKEVAGCIQLIEEMAGAGENLQQIAGDMLEKLHEKWLSQMKNEKLKNKNEGASGGSENKADVVHLNLETDELMELVRLLDKAVVEMKQSEIEQLPLEIALVEWDSNIKNQKLNNKNNESLTKKEREMKEVTVESFPKDENKHQLETRNPSVSSGQGLKLETNYQVVTEEKQTLASDNLVGAVVSLNTVQQKWEELLNRVRPKNHSVQALLRSARPKTVDKNQLVVEVFYPFHLDKLKVETLRRMVEDSIVEVFGWKDVKLQYVLGERTAKPERESKVVSEEEVGKGLGSRVEGFGERNSKSQIPNYKQGVNSKVHKSETRNSKPETDEEDEELVKFAMEVFGK